MKQTFPLIIGFLAIAVLTFLSFQAENIKSDSPLKTKKKRPNIIFIMTDDHTQKAISAYGSQLIQTPNIDRIANEGILFTRSFVTNSICAPSRAVMLTGKYSHMNGLRDNHDVFDTSQMVFPKLLQKVGYQTSIVGKWHLKNVPSGFDDWTILPDQGHYYNPTFIQNGDTIDYQGYVTDIITDLALGVLENRDTTKPFCLVYHQKAPHRNWMPHVKHLSLFNDKDFPLPETFFDDYATRTAAVKEQDMRVEDMFLSMDMKLQPEFYEKETGTGGHKLHKAVADWERLYKRLTEEQKKAWDAHYEKVNYDFKKKNLKGKDLARWKYQRYIKDYLRCVVSVDENVGRLLQYLDENNLTKNTIVVYTSDQGFYLGEHGWYDKRFMYEETLSTPLIIRYPDEIPTGQRTNAMVLNLDYAPTFLDYASSIIPEDIQGKSLRPICKNEPPEDWRTSIYYHYYQSTGWHHVPKHCGVRTERHKLIHYYERDAWEFYDLENDPNEILNLYDNREYAEEVSRLKRELKRLKVYYNDES